MTEKKDFDCVEMKHRAAARIQKELKGKTAKERLAYLRKGRRAMERRAANANAA